MLLGEILCDPLQPLHEGGRQRTADRAVNHQQALSMTTETTREIVEHSVFPEVAHHRTMFAPAEGFGQLEAIAVHRAQLNDADAVELGEVFHALGFAHAVARCDLLQRPLAEHANGGEQQFFIGHHRAFLLLRHFAQQRLRIGHAP